MSEADVKNRSNYGETMSKGSKSAESRDQNGGRPVDPGEPEPGAATGTLDDIPAGEADPAIAGGDAPAEAGQGGDAAGDEQSLSSQLEAARAELAEHKDRYLRAAAEAENIRRRAENDIANARKFAIEGFASEVLSVRDSLEIARSLEINEDDAGAVAKMKEGLDLTLKQLDSTLSKFSIECVDPEKGDKLDPERHQAMSTQESDNVPPNHILAVIQKGYTIHGRLLRPAMVVVAKKPEQDAGAETA